MVVVVRVVVSLKVSIGTQANIVADAFEVEEEEIMWFVGTGPIVLLARVMISSLMLLFELIMIRVVVVVVEYYVGDCRGCES